jgi:hypothetical protein
MTRITENVPAPTLPRDEVLADPARCHLSADGDYLLAYDALTRSGAIFHRLQQTWLIHSPIDATQWVMALSAAGLRPQHVPESEWSELVALSVGCADAARH